MANPRSSTSPVSGSDDGTLRRLGAIVRDCIAQIFGENPFQPRNVIQQPIVLPPQNALPAVLQWGALNRVVVVSTGIQRVQLPNMRPEWVGAPLLVAISQATGFAVQPALTPGSSNIAGFKPLVNGSSTGIVATGIRTCINDGVDWAVY